MFDMSRREFIAVVGGAAAAWPTMATAQQPALPTIGYLSSLSESQVSAQTAAFRRGLNETGFAEGRNITIDFRWAEGRFERLPSMAAELVRRPVSLILAQAPPAALSAKAATASIPIVFIVGFDPVGAGLVANLSKPGGNATGMTLISHVLGQKRLEMIREISAKATVVAMLVNPISPDTVIEIQSVQAGAKELGLKLVMFNASTPDEIEAAFNAMTERQPDALLVGTDPFFLNQRSQIIARAGRLLIPTVYPFRDYAAAGGLMSYGSNISNAYRQAGIYAGRILKGAAPAELPVMQPTTFEIVINLKTATSLGVEIPASVHARSTEVIE
jgi:putative ABC transport system substrate-binding protein